MGKFDFDYGRKYSLKNALRMAELSELAYEPESIIREKVKQRWDFKNFEFFDSEDTQAFMVANDAVVVLAFRGTEQKVLKDWLTDINIKFAKWSYGEVHEGFASAFLYIQQDIKRALKKLHDADQTLWITGHSLGGALAAIATSFLTRERNKITGTYTFGQPRVGNKQFCYKFNEIFNDHFFRFVNANDIVTRVPPRNVGYDHVDQVLYFDRKGRLTRGPSQWNKYLKQAIELILPSAGRIGIAEYQISSGLKDHGIAKYIAKIKYNM